MDSLYGRDSILRNKIDAQGLIYIADISNNLGVWFEHPKTGVSYRKKGVRGCNPTREKADNEGYVQFERIEENLSETILS